MDSQLKCHCQHLLIRPSLDVSIYEGMTLPYGTRKVDSTHIRLLLSAPRFLVGALPASNSGDF